jgi:hypothetical protein
LRQKQINELIGKWKWIPKEGNWAIREDNLVGKMIHITTEAMAFDCIKMPKWKLTQTDKIRFSKSRIVFLYRDYNNEIWDYNINSTTGELKAYYIGEKMNNNYTELVCGNKNYFISNCQ